jgi:hypothetical protein
LKIEVHPRLSASNIKSAPAKANHIDSLMRSATPLRNWKRMELAGHFPIADCAERDLPITKGRLPSGMKIASQVTDEDVFGSHLLRSQSLEPEVI